MAKRLSSVLGVSDQALEATGAFNGFVDVDSLMHVDPHLLATSKIPELQGARATFDQHFRAVAKLLARSKRDGDLFFRAARERLTFKEIPHTALGHSKDDIGGSGIGPVLADHLTRLAKEIIDAGIQDPEIFDLLGLFQESVGPDRISDMTVRVILPHLLAFSERVARDLNLSTAKMRLGDRGYRVPENPLTSKPIVLVPADVLRPIPVAFSWSDVDLVAAHNRALRIAVNKTIGGTWKKATSRGTGKDTLRDTALRHPELLKDLLQRYRDKPAKPYDFRRDPDALILWHNVTEELAREEPLLLRMMGPPSPDGVNQVVHDIVAQFKRLVEANRLSRLLYNDDGSPRPEKIAQLTFYGLAESYCAANNLDISPEADAGAGPVDFKISSGYRYRVTVEVKLTSNPAVVRGFEKQLPAYDAAEQAQHSVYLVIRNTSNERILERLEEARRAAVASGRRVPDVVVVDGRLQPSASKRKAADGEPTRANVGNRRAKRRRGTQLREGRRIRNPRRP